MNSSISGEDRLEAIQAEQKSMSIRLTSGGLTFAIYPTRSFQGAVERHGFIPIRSGHESWVKAIEELFWKHDHLALPYGRVKLYYEPLASVLVPNELHDTSKAEAWLSAVGLIGREDAVHLALEYPLTDENKVLISSWHRPLLQFLQRMHLQLTLAPYWLELIDTRRLGTRSQARHELAIVLRPEAMECIILRGGQISFVNSFAFVHPDSEDDVVGEVIYYLSSVWQALRMQALTDRLHLAYSAEETPEALTLLERITNRVHTELSERLPHISTEAYRSINRPLE